MLTWSNTIPIFAVAIIDMSGVATVAVVLSCACRLVILCLHKGERGDLQLLVLRWRGRPWGTYFKSM